MQFHCARYVGSHDLALHADMDRYKAVQWLQAQLSGEKHTAPLVDALNEAWKNRFPSSILLLPVEDLQAFFRSFRLGEAQEQLP